MCKGEVCPLTMPKNILVLGAGRSATSLINYLLDQASRYDWLVVVADSDKDLAERKVGDRSHGKGTRLNVRNATQRRALVRESDVVISLLPVSLHHLVVSDCIQFKKHLITASYLSKEMIALDEQARHSGIMIMGEVGLDPGIDHMSSMRMIKQLKDSGHTVKSYRSYTGGLIAPENADNPWQYKFTWNPRNVVTAGKGTAQYMLDGKPKYVPPQRIFLEAGTVEVDPVGQLEAYVNRDSLQYRQHYGLDEVPTIIRYTLRYPGFCCGWQALVQLGWTDESYVISDVGRHTYAQLLESFLPADPHQSNLEIRMARFLGIEAKDPVMDKLRWLGIFSNEKVSTRSGSPADVLLDLLLRKWEMHDADRDMVVMHHALECEKDGKGKRVTSSLVMKGQDSPNTAMAKLVGLPLGIFAKLLLTGKIESRGVHLPVKREFYGPVLNELEELDVRFVESTEAV